MCSPMPVTFNPSVPAIIPTVPGNLDQLQQAQQDRIEDSVRQNGEDLRTTLASTSRLMNRLDKRRPRRKAC